MINLSKPNPNSKLRLHINGMPLFWSSTPTIISETLPLLHVVAACSFLYLQVHTNFPQHPCLSENFFSPVGIGNEIILLTEDFKFSFLVLIFPNGNEILTHIGWDFRIFLDTGDEILTVWKVFYQMTGFIRPGEGVLGLADGGYMRTWPPNLEP